MKVKNFVKLLSAIWVIGAINAYACPVVTVAEVTTMIQNEANGHGNLHQNVVGWDGRIDWYSQGGVHPARPVNNVGVPHTYGAAAITVNTVAVTPHGLQAMGGHNFCSYVISYVLNGNHYAAILNLQQ